MAILTAAQLLGIFPELVTLGPPSTLTIGVVSNPAGGEAITFFDWKGQAQIASFVAGTDYTIGPTVDDTAEALAQALTASGLFVASRAGASIFISTVATGQASTYQAVADPVFTLDPLDGAMIGGDALLAWAINLANASLPSQPWGGLHAYGLALYAAHTIAYLAATGPSGASGGGATSGPVQSQTIAQISVTYASINTATIEGAYASTRYGLEFVALRDNLFRPKLGIVGRRRLQTLGGFGWPR
jgi:hypothetical protein